MAPTSKIPGNTGLKLPQYVGVEEICEALGISRSTLDRDRKDGKFPPHVQIRGRIKWPAEAVKEYATARTVTHIKPSVTHAGDNVGNLVTRCDFATAFDCLPPLHVEDADEHGLRMLAECIEVWLPRHGFKGCHVSGNIASGRLMVGWNPNLGYDAERVMRCLRRMEREVQAFGERRSKAIAPA
jgi:predicted DNA-binding transcriptional regulator AlpA